jgi:hypothetical protein
MNDKRTTHTPGEWFVHARLDEELGTLVLSRSTGRDDIIICDCHSWDRTDNAQESANARLIAAAPDLLEVARQCAELAERWGDQGPLVQAARAAIAQAEGTQS